MSNQEGKHLSYAQITQKKKEEREAKEAADRAAAAAATYSVHDSTVDGAYGIDDNSKKNIKEQSAVKHNVHGKQFKRDAKSILEPIYNGCH